MMEKEVEKMQEAQEYLNDTEDEIDNVDNELFAETTDDKEITDFEKWVRSQAANHLKSVKQF